MPSNQSPGLVLPAIGPQTTRNDQSISINLNLPGTKMDSSAEKSAEKRRKSLADFVEEARNTNRSNVIFSKRGEAKGQHMAANRNHMQSDFQTI